jgi:acyl carrier protein
MKDPWKNIEGYVLIVHRRNGGTLAKLDPCFRLLEPVLCLDSLDLAEIMAAVEREFGCSPFDSSAPPQNWGDIVRIVAASRAVEELI